MTELSPRERLALGGVLLVGLALRVAWCLHASRPPSPELHDPNFYRFFGEQLATGKGYRLPDGTPTAYYPVGYALSLGIAFWVLYRTPLPDDIETGVIAGLNVVWQLLAVALVFVLVRRVTGRTGPALVAGGVLALWPNLVFHSAVALTESLFIVLLLVALWIAVSGPWEAKRFDVRRLVLLGLVLGLATLVRPVSLPVFPALVAAWVVARFGWRRALTHGAVTFGAAVVVLLPWAVRNAAAVGQLTLSTNTGDNLCMSRRVGGSGTFELPNPRCFSGPFDRLPRPASEVARDAYGRRLAVEFVRAHPEEELRLLVRRLRETFDDDHDGLLAAESYGTDRFLAASIRRVLATVADGYALVAAVVAAPGLALLVWGRRRPDPARLLLLLTFLGLLLPPLVFFGDSRFHVPAIPFAGIGIGVVAARVAPPRSREPLGSAATLERGRR